MSAPDNASYIVVTADPDLTNQRIFAPNATHGLFKLDQGGGRALNITTVGYLGSLANLEQGGLYASSGGNNPQLIGAALSSTTKTISFQHAGGDTADPICEVINDSNIQKVQIMLNGTTIGTRSSLNFIPGSNIDLSVTDNGINNVATFAINIPGNPGDGSVTSITLSSPSLIISGDNPLTSGDGVIHIDLPLGSIDQVLTCTNTGPYTLDWTDPSGTGTVFSFGLSSTDQSIAISPSSTNPLVAGTGIFNLTLNSWSQNPASSSVNASTYAINNVLEVNGKWFSEQYVYSLIPAGTAALFCANLASSASPSYWTSVLTGYTGSAVQSMPVLVTTAVGIPTIISNEQTPFAQTGFATGGAIVYGTGGSAPCYTQAIIPPGVYGSFTLKIQNKVPFWSQLTSIHSKHVHLGNTSVAPTGSGANIELGDGTYFVADANITASSIVVAHGTALYDDETTEPSIGPVSVRLNTTTGSGQLPVGFIIYGDPTYDNGNRVTYSILAY